MAEHNEAISYGSGFVNGADYWKEGHWNHSPATILEERKMDVFHVQMDDLGK